LVDAWRKFVNSASKAWTQFGGGHEGREMQLALL